MNFSRREMLTNTGAGLGIVGLHSLMAEAFQAAGPKSCLLYTSPSPRDRQKSRMPSSA